MQQKHKSCKLEFSVQMAAAALWSDVRNLYLQHIKIQIHHTDSQQANQPGQLKLQLSPIKYCCLLLFFENSSLSVHFKLHTIALTC